MFKNGPITGILGIVILVATWLHQALESSPIPQTGKEWLAFLVGNATGLFGLFAKDFNKSNAPAPTPEAHTVKIP